MQRHVSISLIVLLLISTTGLSIQQHYCMGSLEEVSISFLEGEQHPCGCEAPMDHDCCQNETSLLKIEDQFQHATTFTGLQASFSLIAVYHYLYQAFMPDTDRQTQHFTTYTSPPVWQDIPVRVQTFLL